MIKILAEYDIEVVYIISTQNNKWYNESNEYVVFNKRKYKMITKRFKMYHNYAEDSKVAFGIAKMIAQAYAEAVFPNENIKSVSIYSLKLWVNGKYMGELY